MEILLSCLVLFLLSVGAGKFFSFLLSKKDVQSVRKANELNEKKQSVFLKKYKEVDMNRWQTTNKLLGLAVATAFLLISAESFTKRNKIKVEQKPIDYIEPISAWIEPMEEYTPPPPKKKIELPPPKKIEVPIIEEITEPIEDKIEVETPEVIDETPLPEVPMVPRPVIKNKPKITPPPPPPPVITKTPPKTEILKFAEVMPKFEGGLNELRRQIGKSYDIPLEFKRSGEKRGKITTRFVVLEDGTIGEIQILKGITGCEACSEEAIKSIRSVKGKFSPGKQAGKPVKVWFTLPIEIMIR